MFRELDLNWRGESKRLKPTMDLLRYLENRGIGPHAIAAMRAKGAIAPATFADFVATVLQYAGFAVTPDDVYADAHTDVKGLQQLRETADTFMIAMLPASPPRLDADPKKKPVKPSRKATPAR